MSKKELVKRYILFIIGLFFTGIGVAITKKGELGISPISSLSNVVNCRFEQLSMGTCLLIFNLILLLGQILILRKNFKLIQLTQIPLSILFGWFTDFGVKVFGFLPNDAYYMKIILVIVGDAVLAFGVALTVIANVVMNSGEAFVKAVSDVTGKNFGDVKIMFDISCVICAVILSLIFFGFKLVGVREGTVIAAILTGNFVKLYMKFMKNPVEKALVK